jgi:hypothetical protein
MKQATELCPGAMIYIPSFMKTGPGIQKLMWEGGLHRQHGDLISLVLIFFFKIRKAG